MCDVLLSYFLRHEHKINCNAFNFGHITQSHYMLALPSIILGLLSLMGAALCLLLPETLNRVLPTTLEDGENFGRGERFYHFACCENAVTESTSVLHGNGNANGPAIVARKRTYI